MMAWQHYLYDGSGQLMAIRYKGADYYYIRDGLMTITGLIDANGNIQACAIASVIQIAVYKAKSMKKKQNNRRKKGWIDLEGIRKRRTYN